MCNWGFGKPWEWKPPVAHMYRIFYDIKPTESSIHKIVEEGKKLNHLNGPNNWMDLDMLEIGNGISKELSKYHFEMWCKLRSPLMLSMDLRHITDEDYAIITNQKLIDMNQNGSVFD